MPNPKIVTLCKRCDVEGKHYTRSSGMRVSPCCACIRARQQARALDETAAARSREAYRRYNASEKGQERLARHRARPPASPGVSDS